MLSITDTQALAARKHCGPKLRSLGIKDIRDFAPHALSWGELHERKKALVALAQSTIDKITDGTSMEEARDLEAAYEAIMAAHDECVGEMDVRGQLGDKSPRSTGGDPRRPMPPDMSVRGDGGAIEEAEEPSPLLTPEQRMADRLSNRSNELRGLTLGRYLRAMVAGASNEQERRALVEGTDSAGGYTVPEVLSANLIDLMRARTVAIRAGARTVPLTSDRNHVAKLASDPVPVWRAEAGTVSESDPTFTRVTFEPKSLAVLVKVSRELLEDSLNLETDLPRILAAAMAQELDRVVFLGTGTGDEPSGLDTIAGVQSLAHDAAIENYSPLVTARKMLMAKNVEQVTAYVMHSDLEAEFGGLVDTTGQPLRHPPILDRPAPLNLLTTTQLPTNLGTDSNESTIYAGDFRQLVIGMRSNIRIEVLRERYADTLEYGFLCFMRADVAAVHPQAFCRITGVQLL